MDGEENRGNIHENIHCGAWTGWRRPGLRLAGRRVERVRELESMKVKAGVWIDHRKALIVLMTAAGERAVHIVSKAEKHLQRSGDSPLKGRYEAQQVPADDSRENADRSAAHSPTRASRRAASRRGLDA